MLQHNHDFKATWMNEIYILSRVIVHCEDISKHTHYLLFLTTLYHYIWRCLQGEGRNVYACRITDIRCFMQNYWHPLFHVIYNSCRITDIRCFKWSYRSHETTDVSNSAYIYIVAFPQQTPSYVVIQNSKKQQMMCMLKYIFTVNYESWKNINFIHSYCFEIIGSVTKRPYVLFYLLTRHFYQTT